ncbi:Fis family transcriptional regulator [Mycobacteroides abscessus subsp. abscessus]|nr:Fis family transcriptional regulator [Mycobacteroides abscessus subsp. abscessus]
MTDPTDPTLIDEEAATDSGAQGLAAADLAGQTMRLLHQALDASDLDQKALAEKLGVTQGRVSQVLNGDGNVRIAALARYLRALGYETRLSAIPVDPGQPTLPRASRRRRTEPESRQAVDEKRYVVRLQKKRSRVRTSNG